MDIYTIITNLYILGASIIIAFALVMLAAKRG